MGLAAGAAIAGVATIGGSLISSKAAKKAAKTQSQAAQSGIAEQQAARNQYYQYAQPYIGAGAQALGQQQALTGGGGTDWEAYAQAHPEVISAFQNHASSGGGQISYDPQTGSFTAGPQLSLADFAQNYYNTIGKNKGHDIGPYSAGAQSISALENNPIFQGLYKQGEDAILQNASATGGLRGGNVQGALAQYRPALLNQFLQDQYARLAQLSTTGANAAAGAGNAGIATANNVSTLLGQQGQAQAGGALAQGQILSSGLGNLAGLIQSQIGGGQSKGTVVPNNQAFAGYKF